jgi:hypothetical protein
MQVQHPDPSTASVLDLACVIRQGLMARSGEAGETMLLQEVGQFKAYDQPVGILLGESCGPG